MALTIGYTSTIELQCRSPPYWSAFVSNPASHCHSQKPLSRTMQFDSSMFSRKQVLSRELSVLHFYSQFLLLFSTLAHLLCCALRRPKCIGFLRMQGNNESCRRRRGEIFALTMSKVASKNYKRRPSPRTQVYSSLTYSTRAYTHSHLLSQVQWTLSPTSPSHLLRPLRRRASPSPTKRRGRATPTASSHRSPSPRCLPPTSLVAPVIPIALSPERSAYSNPPLWRKLCT